MQTLQYTLYGCQVKVAVIKDKTGRDMIALSDRCHHGSNIQTILEGAVIDMAKTQAGLENGQFQSGCGLAASRQSPEHEDFFRVGTFCKPLLQIILQVNALIMVQGKKMAHYLCPLVLRSAGDFCPRAGSPVWCFAEKFSMRTGENICHNIRLAFEFFIQSFPG